MEIVLYVVAGVFGIWVIGFSLAARGHKERMKFIVNIVNEAVKHKISAKHEMLLLGIINKANEDPNYAIDIYEKFKPILDRNGFERTGLGMADMTSQHLPEYVPHTREKQE